MSTICDELNNWDEMDENDKLEFLTDFINDYLADEGYGPVNVTVGPDEHESGSWHVETKTINFNSDRFSEESARELLNTAMHEASHAEKDFEGGHQTPIDEDDVIRGSIVFEEDGTVSLWHPPGTAPRDPEHREIYLYAQEVSDMIMDACEDAGEPQSGSERNLPPGDWVIPEGNGAYA